jgi:asparagine synthase (glutamine-hydrolysing)
MCGFVGFLTEGGSRDSEATVLAMARAIAHRGPDADGAWVDNEAGVAFGHRRLSIVDLSAAGHQPMASSSGRYMLVFNGEIYNFPVLRLELEQRGHTFRGNSDTEVMLAAFEAWGIEASLKRFVGMFAFALWDRLERQLTLGRDRLGEKPLYYGWISNTFLFGSELKGLRAHPLWRGEINRDALAVYLRHNYVPGPYSIYHGVHKLPPGTYLNIRFSMVGQSPEPISYWSARQVAEAGLSDPFKGSAAEAVDALETLLKDAVRQQMVADVPLGAFLSGGIDSSTIVALMQSQSDRPVKTFSIGFHEEGYDEAVHAKSVAGHLGTEHTELYVSPQEALDVIPRLPTLYDEPFADSSQIPTFLVAQLARRHVTVSLSGDAGDELFAGYNRYFWGRSLWRRLGPIPLPVRTMAAAGLTALPPAGWDAAFKATGWALPAKLRLRTPGDKLHKLAAILAVDSPETMYRKLVSHWETPSDLLVAGSEPPTALTDLERWAALPDFTQRMMHLDLVSYLPDDILVKVDRAAMGVSLESRVPMLDHRVVEFAGRIPMNLKIREGQGKWILRQVLHRYVPQALIDRPKMGFGVPIDSWLRGPLREWAEDLLSEPRLRNDGYFDPALIHQKWHEHLSGKRNWQYHLWDVLMFQAWLKEESANRPVTGSLS